MEVYVELSKKKTVIQEFPATNQKRPSSVENPNSFYDQTPVWSFSRCDFDHKTLGLSNHQEKILDLLVRLKDHERMTWREILTSTSGKKKGTRSHSIPINEIDKAAQRRLYELHLDDFDELYSIRLDSLHRLWGIITNGTFCIIWDDLNHAVCPSKKRRT